MLRAYVEKSRVIELHFCFDPFYPAQLEAENANIEKLRTKLCYVRQIKCAKLMKLPHRLDNTRLYDSIKDVVIFISIVDV